MMASLQCLSVLLSLICCQLVSTENVTVTGYVEMVGQLSMRYKTSENEPFSPWHLADYCMNGQKVSLVISLGSKVQYRFVTFSTESIETTSPFVTVFVSQYCDRDLKIKAPLCNSIIGAGVFISEMSFLVSQCNDSEDEDFNSFFVQVSNCRPQILQFRLDFSLVLHYPNPPQRSSCWPLSNAKEGVLVTALFGDGSILPLQYFTITGGNIAFNKPHVSITEFSSSYCQLRVRLQDASYIIPVDRTNVRGPVSHTIYLSDDRMFTENVSFSWTQYRESNEGDCDVWSLDDVRVSIDTNGSNIILYNEDFGSGNICETSWNCTYAQISKKSKQCNNERKPCLFFTGGTEKDRVAMSPVINKHLSAFYDHSIYDQTIYDQCVLLNEAATLPLVSSLSCNGLMVNASFILRLRKFILSSSSSNAILLSLVVDSNTASTPLAYYAPVGNKYWTNFNTTHLNGVPIYSPNPIQYTGVSFCVHKNTELVSLIWRQENYTSNYDVWSISQPIISTDLNEVYNTSLNYSNGGISNESVCAGEGPILLMDGGDGLMPREATYQYMYNIEEITSSSLSDSYMTDSSSTTMTADIISTSITTDIMSITSTMTDSSPIVTPTGPAVPVLMCFSDGVWPDTPVNQTANGTCSKGMANATRLCKANGVWGTVNCNASQAYNRILEEASSDPLTALVSLNLSVSSNDSSGELEIGEATVLLDVIVTASQNMTTDKAETVFNIASKILKAEDMQEDQGRDSNGVASQLLVTMDKLAFKLVDPNVTISTPSIRLRSQLLLENTTEALVDGISSEANSISLPNEIFNTSTVPVRVASFIYKNMSSVLVQRNSSLQLVSPVVSATTDCEECTTTGLTKPVSITFNISSSSYQMMISSNKFKTVCAFWDFESLSEDSLPTGRWNSSGCDVTRKDGSSVQCSCNHLTHFAILLSPNSEVSNLHRDILRTIGYVLVPISLICMLLTILTYSCMKKLHSMRNYTHIMLCSNLFIAQLSFLIGVQRTENKVACSVIAVVLQYMFLVTFMWMLMEGVVLYITLVKIFISRTKRYGVSFTILSYGIPAVYMMIVVPIGYLVDTGNDQPNHYLYYDNEELVACWLSYETGFIWTFIAPVILIILINTYYLFVAFCIMKKHWRKLVFNTQVDDVRYWLKSSLSLTVVMGIAWLGNVLFFRKELLFIAYIMTVFIAAQGIIIFILYVPLSSHVRAAYSKSWNDKRANTGYFSAMLLKRASLASTRIRNIKNISQSVSATIKSSETPTSSVFVGNSLSISPPNDPNKSSEQELDSVAVPPLPNDYITSEIDSSFVFVNEASIEKEISDE